MRKPHGPIRALSLPGPNPGLIRRALTGVTPQLLAILAALMLARMLSVMIGDMVLRAHEHAFGAWLLELLIGFSTLMAQAVPMAFVIVATANLGPQQGWKRVLNRCRSRRARPLLHRLA